MPEDNETVTQPVEAEAANNAPEAGVSGDRPARLKAEAAREERGDPDVLLAELEHNIGGGADGQQEHGQDSTMHPEMQRSTRSLKSSSSPALGTYSDLKKKTEFAGTSVDGVLKRTTYMHSVSNYQRAPAFAMGERCGKGFITSSDTPAPGSYNTPNDEKSKFNAPPKFSFGGSSRFGLGQSPAKKQPGPGAYTPKDPANETSVKVGFSSSMRSKGFSPDNPGPGAYEYRTCVGQGLMFTARGRHPTSYMRARSQPGPGAYDPSTSQIFGSSLKCGFGTSTRSDIAGAARNLVSPGPGTYDLQNKKAVGEDAPKYSATSRRRMHDLNSYVTPGPGSYNSHITSFGQTF